MIPTTDAYAQVRPHLSYSSATVIESWPDRFKLGAENSMQARLNHVKPSVIVSDTVFNCFDWVGSTVPSVAGSDFSLKEVEIGADLDFGCLEAKKDKSEQDSLGLGVSGVKAGPIFAGLGADAGLGFVRLGATRARAGSRFTGIIGMRAGRAGEDPGKEHGGGPTRLVPLPGDGIFPLGKNQPDLTLERVSGEGERYYVNFRIGAASLAQSTAFLGINIVYATGSRFKLTAPIYEGREYELESRVEAEIVVGFSTRISLPYLPGLEVGLKASGSYVGEQRATLIGDPSASGGLQPPAAGIIDVGYVVKTGIVIGYRL